MRILVDEALPDGRSAFADLGEVVTFNGRQLKSVRDADALIVRSVTRVDSDLLTGSKVRFVGTATSGVDHIDQDYLARQGICFADAAGCNSRAVAEFVIAAMLLLAERHNFELAGRTLGVVGRGRIGAIVVDWAKLLGMRVLVCDPPLAQVRAADFVDSRTLAGESDIVTFHVPLTTLGADRTRNMVDQKWFSTLKTGASFINTSRGEIVDEAALLGEIRSQRVGGAVLDVWQNEPAISPEMVIAATLATPHVAGYSVEAKHRAVWMIRDALVRHMRDGGMVAPAETSLTRTCASRVSIKADASTGESVQKTLARVIAQACDINAIDFQMRDDVRDSIEKRSAAFESLRVRCASRREFAEHTIALPAGSAAASLLRRLGFEVELPG
jgi:erythronate-4-phosphate dehydrogenase